MIGQQQKKNIVYLIWSRECQKKTQHIQDSTLEHILCAINNFACSGTVGIECMLHSRDEPESCEKEERIDFTCVFFANSLYTPIADNQFIVLNESKHCDIQHWLTQENPVN